MSENLQTWLPENFFEEYWQKKPLFIKGALRGKVPDFTANDLAGLALEDDTFSRIVKGCDESGYQVKWGPLKEPDFEALADKKWTLLVQEVNHHIPEVQGLMNLFRFLPGWRLDDIMVSFAAPGGSVGPHLDQYDVFLVQGEGTRNWQVGKQSLRNPKLQSNDEIALLEAPHFSFNWLAERGDVLYIPPGFAHHGIAEEACLTFSVGFRAPSISDALGALFQTAEELEAANEVRFKDQVSRFKHNMGSELTQVDVENFKKMVVDFIDENKSLVTESLGKLLTESKRSTDIPEVPVYSKKTTIWDSVKNQNISEDQQVGPFSKLQWLRFLSEWQAQGNLKLTPDARLCFYDLKDEDQLLLMYQSHTTRITRDAMEATLKLCNERLADFNLCKGYDPLLLLVSHLYEFGLASGEIEK